MISYESNPILKRILDSMYCLIDFLDLQEASKSKTALCTLIDKSLETQLQTTDLGAFVPEHMLNSFIAELGRFKGELDSVRTSTIAMAVGRDPTIQYPIHMLSSAGIPDDVFWETDDHLFRVYFEETPRGLSFEVMPAKAEGVRLWFCLPKNIYFRYFAERRMLDFKMKFLRHIEFPVSIRGIRRILRLNLDEEWVRRQQQRSG